jgi:hypothetical protein
MTLRSFLFTQRYLSESASLSGTWGLYLVTDDDQSQTGAGGMRAVATAR